MKSCKNRRKAIEQILLLFFLCILSSCGSASIADAGVEIRIEEYGSENGTIVQIPAFYAEDEQVLQSLRELERETKKLRRIYERAQKNNTYLDMRCYPEDTERFLQVTVVWHTVEDGNRTYDLVSLCADEKESLPITCREALERTGMSGVDLSLQVGKLAQEAGLRGQVSAMEMQGFRIDDTGTVREIYMKLLMELEEEEETVEEEHFFSYIPAEDRLVRLSENGFDVP